jgi:spore coat protein CotH
MKLSPQRTLAVLVIASILPLQGRAPVLQAAVQGPPPFGGMGGVQEDIPLVAQFDKDGDKRLNSAERHAAMEYMKSSGAGMRGGRRGGMAMAADPATPGPRVAKNAVKTYAASVPFYDSGTLRTLFFDFEDADWEDQLMAFKNTDVEVPATLTVDGKAYPQTDVQFRGASSFMMVPEGRKHSLNVTLDNVSKDQNVLGYSSLNLLNAHEDPTLLRSVLFLEAARDYIPAAKANFVRVVINGESWGIFSNVQQADKTFIEQWFKTKDGTRWKVPGSPNGRGGLEYWTDTAQYKRTFEMKGKDSQKAWDALINFTRVLNTTPADKLEAALEPILDIDGALRFLALDNTFVNNDGYWVRASDYNIYLDTAGRFHILPHDTNETFASGGGGRGGGARGMRPGGPGFGPGGPGFGPPGGPGRGGRGMGMMGGDATLDPLIGLDDASKPLRSKLLAVPALRAKYLAYTKEMATKWLDWRTLGPIVTRHRALIEADVKTDTRKLDSNEAFDAGLDALRTFAEQRRAAILQYQAR